MWRGQFRSSDYRFMHPFCCASNVPDRSPRAPPSPAPEILPVPYSTASFRSLSAGRSLRPESQSSFFDPPPAITCRSGGDHVRPIRRSAMGSQSFDHRGVKINDILGNGISGILRKWVNYGRGWRPRWFVLRDGVFSYYKVRGPDKIFFDQEIEKGSKVIGKGSMRRRLSRNRNGTQSQLHRKPVGEVHLKVSSLRESKSDDKRFSIFTGTKTLHLRADTQEDRARWTEALQAVKDLFLRLSNSELMASQENAAISTERLRQQLLEEGVAEAAIKDSEQIMRNEFSMLQNYLVVLQQKQLLLLDTLRQLETEKVDLENTVVDESQRQSKEHEFSFRSREDKISEGNASDFDDDSERHDPADEETVDDENAFFGTQDFLSSSSLRSNGSDFQMSSFDSDDENAFDLGDSVDSSIKAVGSNFSYIRQRKKLPDPLRKRRGVSLWSMIKDNIGKDLTKVCLPVYFNEPISSLQKCFEDLEYSHLIDRAYEWGKMDNSLMRILNVAAFAVSGYASTDAGHCKPFNPLLGETYEAEYPDKGLRFFSEKVSHHPMIVDCHCEGHGWKFWGDSNPRSKFWGRSIQLGPEGILTLEFDDGEVFRWSKVTTSICGLILGKLYCDHYGTMRIQGNHDYSCKLKFKEQSIINRNPHQVQGIVRDRNGKTVATLFGKWDESMYCMEGDCARKAKGSEALSEAWMLWKRSKPSRYQTRYNLTRFAIPLNELIHGLKEKLPPTDSRLRPDQRCLENGEYEMANSEKLRLEQRQRQSRKM